jgi:hypothetical protein
LEERWNRADLIELYKILQNQSSIKIADMFQLARDARTRGHTLKLGKDRSRLDLHKYLFFVRVVDRWNALDQDTVSSGTLNGFNNSLAVVRQVKKGFFTDTTCPPDSPGAAHQVIYQIQNKTRWQIIEMHSG